MLLTVVNIFNKLLLNVLHTIYFVYLKLKLFKPFANKILYNINAYFTDNDSRNTIENDFIERTVKLYPKIPKHVVFAVGEEHIYYEDIIQIILWSIPTGVPTLSFYDHKNEINAELLYKLFVKNHRDISSCIKWGVSFNEKLYKENVYANNGFTGSKPRLQVNVLNSKHGRQLLIDCIKELSLNTDLDLDNSKSVAAAIDKVMLDKMESSPDPDLLVISGDCFTTFGLSPWHIGFTEFALIPSYRLLTPYEFIKILKQYAYCEQNFGT